MCAEVSLQPLICCSCSARLLARTIADVALACLDLEELVAERMIAASHIIIALGILRTALTLLLLSLARV